MAVGARVRASTGSKTYWREVTDGYNYRAQSDPSFVHLGIGNKTSVRVMVRWPGGRRSCARFKMGERSLAAGSRPCGS